MSAVADFLSKRAGEMDRSRVAEMEARLKAEPQQQQQQPTDQQQMEAMKMLMSEFQQSDEGKVALELYQETVSMLNEAFNEFVAKKRGVTNAQA